VTIVCIIDEPFTNFKAKNILFAVLRYNMDELSKVGSLKVFVASFPEQMIESRTRDN